MRCPRPTGRPSSTCPESRHVRVRLGISGVRAPNIDTARLRVRLTRHDGACCNHHYDQHRCRIRHDEPRVGRPQRIDGRVPGVPGLRIYLPSQAARCNFRTSFSGPAICGRAALPPPRTAGIFEPRFLRAGDFQTSISGPTSRHGNDALLCITRGSPFLGTTLYMHGTSRGSGLPSAWRGWCGNSRHDHGARQ